MGRHAVFLCLVLGAFATVAACSREDGGLDTAATCDGAQGKSASPCSTGPQYPEEWAYSFPEGNLAFPDGCLNPTSAAGDGGGSSRSDEGASGPSWVEAKRRNENHPPPS
jgi:hypothetical protein